MFFLLVVEGLVVLLFGVLLEIDGFEDLEFFLWNKFVFLFVFNILFVLWLRIRIVLIFGLFSKWLKFLLMYLKFVYLVFC